MTVKPIIAFQTASVDIENGDRALWLRDMFHNLAGEDQVIGAIYFNRQKTEGGKYNDYRIIKNGVVDPTVVAEYPKWSAPSEAAWIFDGRMEAWEQERQLNWPLGLHRRRRFGLSLRHRLAGRRGHNSRL